MQLVKYDPMQELANMQKDFDKFWGQGWGLPVFGEMNAMDMYEEDGKLVTEVNLPHFKKEEVVITADQGMLEISAEHKEKEEKKSKRRYYFRESSDSFMRRVALPEGADTNKAEASFEKGTLKVIMPMTPAKKLSSIKIK